MRWLTCLLPPLAFIVFEETPGLSGLNGINAAALVVLSPFVLAGGFGVTAAICGVARWLTRLFRLKSRVGFAILTLALVGLLSVPTYLDNDWLLLGVTELASLPAGWLLAPRPKTASIDEVFS